MKKRLLSLLLVVALVFSLSGTALAAGFNDTVGHEAEAAIDRWTGHGVVSGDAGTGTFRPNGTLTRAEMAKIIANLVGLKKGADITMYGDVPENEWYAPYIAMCVAAGIMNGRDDSTMDPTGEVTQQEFYTMLGRALALTPQANADTTFADSSTVADYASGYVNALADLGALSGDAMNNLNPTDPIPRGAVMMVMDKTIDDYVDTDGAEVTAGTGITLIVADDVTVTGQVENLIVGGDNAAVTVAPEATVKTATVVGPETALTVEGTATAVKVDQKAAGAAVEVAPAAQVQALTTAAPATSLAVSGQVGTVSMAETAQQATVTVQEQAKVDTLITAAPKAEVEVSGAVAAVQVANTAQQATVTVAETAKVDTLTAAAPETSVAVSGSVASVQVADTAEKANVTVNEAAKVDTLTTAAPETSVAVSGTVSSVEVADTAAKTEITTSSTAKVEKVDTKADNVAVTGDGKVDNVAVSGNDTAVQTGGTKVDVATGTTGTTAGDTEVKPGDTATTTPSGDSAETKPSTPSTPSKPSTPDEDEDDEPAHSHRWSAWADNGNGTHSRECACGEVRTQNCAYASAYDKDSSGHWYTCTVCGGATAVTAHTYDTNNCAALATCTACGYEKAAGAHQYGNWAVDSTDSTKHTRACTSCGVKETADHDSDTTIPAVDATCTETGLTEGKKCSVCGKITVEQTATEKAAHAEQAIPAVPATCTETGLTAGVKCSVCDVVLTAQETIPANGHTWVAATCTAPKTCSVCKVTEGEKLDHTYGETNVCSCGAVETGYVAVVDGQAYQDLQTAIDAADGKTVKLATDVELSAGLVIVKDTTVTLDLNGKTVSYASSEAKGNAAIQNKGILTIMDSGENGTITYSSSKPAAAYGYGTNTISNEGGTLTVTGVTIVNTTDGGSSVAIDNNSTLGDTTLTVADSTVTSVKVAIRQYVNSNAYSNDVTIDGDVTGAYAAQIHVASGAAPKASLTINGGTLTATNETKPYAVYVWSDSSAYTNVEVDINDGTFSGILMVVGGTGTPAITKASDVTLAAPEGYVWADDTTLTKVYTLDDLSGENAKNLTGKINVSAINADLKTNDPNISIGDEFGNASTAYLANSGVTEIVINGGVINTPYKGDTKIDSATQNDSSIKLAVPDNTKIVFKDLTINGHYNFTAVNIAEYAVTAKNLTLEFEDCTFNGCWVGYVNQLTNIKFTNCRFTLTDDFDTTKVKDTNPLWLRPGTDGSTLTLDRCTISGNRPVKYGEYAFGHTLNVTGCTFNLASAQYDINDNRPDRVTAVRFDDKVTTVNITGNTMVSGYAFYQTNNEPYSVADYTDSNNTKPADALWRVEY